MEAIEHIKLKESITKDENNPNNNNNLVLNVMYRIISMDSYRHKKDIRSKCLIKTIIDSSMYYVLSTHPTLFKICICFIDISRQSEI